MEDCKRKVWPIKVMAAITMSVAMVVAVVHVILLVAHFRRLVQTRFWRQPLRFPNGQLTLEVTVRMLREPERRDRVA